MDTALWIVQILLGLAFIGAGIMKATQPHEKIKAMLPWAEDFAPSTVKIIGTLELLGGLGLILPMLTNILPILTPLAAVGLVLTMIGAALTHVRRGEYPMIAINLVLLALAAFVVYGRLVAVPIA